MALYKLYIFFQPDKIHLSKELAMRPCLFWAFGAICNLQLQNSLILLCYFYKTY